MHLNRNYRILWSEACQQWVVASELASPGGKGKSRGAISRLVCAVLLAGGLLAGAPEGALADTCPTASTTIGGPTVNGQCIVTGAETVNVNAGGNLTNTFKTVPGTISVDLNGSGVNIDNSGNILSSSIQSAISINVAATGTTITNRAAANIGAPGPGASSNSHAAIEYLGGIDAQLSNSGTINVTYTGVNTRVTAVGVNAVGALSSTLTNSGTITTKTTLTKNSTSASSAYDAIAYGIKLGSVSATTGNLSNSGTIKANAINNGNNLGGSSVSSISVTAYGVKTGVLAGTLANSGTISKISATALNTGQDGTSSINVIAYGVHALTISATTGVLTNEGTISSKATNSGLAGTSSITVKAYGVFNNTLAGALTNSGSLSKISATAINNGNALSSPIRVTAYGVLNNTTLSGTLTNGGTISATATNSGTGTASSVFATGVHIASMGATGKLDNSGTISAASSKSASSAYSLRVLASTGGTINNQVGGVLIGNIATPAALTQFDNAGTIEIPDGVTTASIAGSYSQQSGGKLTIDASSAASHGILSTGPANLIAGSVIDVKVAAVNTLVAGDVLLGVFTSTSLTAGTLTVTDNSSTLDFTATVNGNSIDLTAVNVPPPPALVAVGDTVISRAMSVTTGNVLANDAGSGLLRITAFDAVSVNGGAIISNGNGVFTYTRPANFVGNDSFTYTIKDSLGRSSIGTVTVVVNGPPSALWVNKYFFRPGDTLALSASITPGTLAGRVVDVYITIRMPTGQTVYLIADGTASPTPTPYIGNWSEAAGTGILFNYVFQGTEPLGGYAVNGFFTAPGTMTSAGVMAGGNFYFLP